MTSNMKKKEMNLPKEEGMQEYEDNLFGPIPKKETTGRRYQTQLGIDPDNPFDTQFTVCPCDDGRRGFLEPDVVIYDQKNGEVMAWAYIPGIKDDPLKHVVRK